MYDNFGQLVNMCGDQTDKMNPLLAPFMEYIVAEADGSGIWISYLLSKKVVSIPCL